MTYWNKPRFKKKDNVRFGSKIFEVVKIHLLSGRWVYELNNGELAGAEELTFIKL